MHHQQGAAQCLDPLLFGQPCNLVPPALLFQPLPLHGREDESLFEPSLRATFCVAVRLLAQVSIEAIEAISAIIGRRLGVARGKLLSEKKFFTF